jgi:hypothetical protein
MILLGLTCPHWTVRYIGQPQLTSDSHRTQKAWNPTHKRMLPTNTFPNTVTGEMSCWRVVAVVLSCVMVVSVGR